MTGILGNFIGGVLGGCSSNKPVTGKKKEDNISPLVFGHIELARKGVLHVYGLVPNELFLESGTRFTIPCVNALDVLTGEDAGYKKEFVVLADVYADRIGHGIILFSPKMIAEYAINQTEPANVTSLPAYNAVIETNKGIPQHDKIKVESIMVEGEDDNMLVVEFSNGHTFKADLEEKTVNDVARIFAEFSEKMIRSYSKVTT